MKKRLVAFLAIVFAVSFFIFLQQRTESKLLNSSKTQTFSELIPLNVRAAAFGVSAPVSSFAPAVPASSETNKKTADEKARAVPNNLPFRKQIPGAIHDADAALARASALPMPTPLLSFNGISSNDNAAAFGFRVIPPDTNGDVGPNHYVQSVNSLTRVFDKSGNLCHQMPMFQEAMKFAKQLSANNGTILMVGTKRTARETVAADARRRRPDRPLRHARRPLAFKPILQ